jgi:hypothetical protein
MRQRASGYASSTPVLSDQPPRAGPALLRVQRRHHTVGIMAVVLVCVLLVLLGLVAVLWSGGLTFQAPSGDDPAGHPSVGLVLRSYIWYVTARTPA